MSEHRLDLASIPDEPVGNDESFATIATRYSAAEVAAEPPLVCEFAEESAQPKRRWAERRTTSPPEEKAPEEKSLEERAPEEKARAQESPEEES